MRHERGAAFEGLLTARAGFEATVVALTDCRAVSVPTLDAPPDAERSLSH
jgi:hypothetical protein